MPDRDDLSAGLIARLALEKSGFKVTRSLGQNFLLDDGVIGRILDLSGVRAGDRVLEIGPGPGVMTRCMALRGAAVTSVELDQGLKDVLDDVLKGLDVRLVFADFLKTDIDALMGGKPYRVVANLPYYITADAVTKLLLQAQKPESVTVMVQKEAAGRIMSRVGTKEWCLLAAIVRYFGKCEALMELPPQAFTPPPHVDSTLLKIDVYEKKPHQAKDEAVLLKVMEACFAMRRKTLLNNLMRSFSVPRQMGLEWLGALGVDEKIRGEALDIGQLVALADGIAGARS